MEKLVELGLKPAIKVKETFRQKVKHPLRKDSRIFWEKWGRNRYLIESLFGTVKLKIGSHFRVRKEEIAQKRGLAAFVLYNMYLLATLLYISLLLKNYFRTLSYNGLTGTRNMISIYYKFE
ncbi:Mobile element protein [Thermosulfurimonas dismutans]|uniref:Mobile element protein n=1 Tax=Thermosulfurimonas dismutans TaxID=999894 RepID=A0A179D198_9BACT|nr:Mobile element protein [Thermosulfurimonas dismutans]